MSESVEPPVAALPPQATPAPGPGTSPRKRRPMKVATVTFLVLLLAGGAIYTWNYLTLQKPLQAVLEEDSRNEGISARAHHKYYLSPSTLVFDLRGLSGAHSRADVFRVLLQYASKLKETSFDTVLLAYGGDVKFMLDGDYFKTLGEEYGSQNPMYTMRTFPSHLKRADGTGAYGEWTGGALGVLGKQMEDFGDFCDKWFLNN